ncbi:MAG: carboxypeptidase M32 [Candidatus Hydrogenedens sp.]
MKNQEERFLELKQRLSEIINLRAVFALLQWDEEVNMPQGGAESRGQQLKLIAEMIHKLETNPLLGDDLAYFTENQDNLDIDEQVMVREAMYDYQRSVKIPEQWVGKFAQARSRAYHAWVEARNKSVFSLFQSSLEAIINLCRERAELLGYIDSPYDALLEDFERGIDTKLLDTIFHKLESEQSHIYQTILQQDVGKSVFEGKNWDTEKQWEITIHLLTAIGFDFNSGRQDRSVHPFTTNFDVYDVRITTRLNEEHLFSGIFSSLHEGGHALYEQGFYKEDRGTWLAQAPSLGIHESQSRFWENIIGRSYPFSMFLLPILKKYFPSELKDITPEIIYKEVNRVSPNCIRVEADECSYNLHIVLRYKIEKDLIEGKLSISDIPECWNERFKSLLGYYPSNDAQGCLQDIHWSHGSFGYFPSYALGNLFSAQITDKMKSELDISKLIKQGDFIPIRDWLKEHVYKVGRRLCARDIVKNITGSDISHQPYITYLKHKYGEIYKINW